MRKGSFLMKRSLAAVLTASLAVTLVPPTVCLQPGGGETAAKAAETNNPADCKNVSDTVSGKEKILFEKEDGSSSDSGLQKTKMVDSSGKTVDSSEYTNEEYVDDGEAVEYIENKTGTAQGDPEAGFNSTVSGSLPAKYGTILTKKPVNQGSWGVCWSFGCTAAMEANIVKQGSAAFPGLNTAKDTIELSERYLAWFSHNTYATDKTDMAYGDGKKLNTPAKAYKGGNETQVSYALAVGTGPELESTAKYDTSSAMKGVTENLRPYSVAKLRDMNKLNLYDYSPENVTTVKTMVKNYGAATVTYGSVTSYYKADSNGATNFYYGVRGSSHMVAIVGWDDSYAASNFKKTPKGNGAWLCRNSWGSEWGEGSKADGYFWMSYYEPTYNITAFDMQSADAYGKAYYYVRDAGVTYYNTTDSANSFRTATAANVFRAEGAETLKSVGIQTASNGLQAEITVYTSDTAMSKPTDGTKQGTTTVQDLGLVGYHQVDLSKTVSLKAGQYFSVIVKLTGDTSIYMVYEANGSGTEKKGQSYVYSGLSDSWTDVTAKSLSKIKNPAIYAYTNPQATEAASLQKEVAAAKLLKKADVTASSGEEVWNRIQAELSLGQKAMQAQTVKRSIRMLQSAMSNLSSLNLYADSSFTDGPGKNGVEIYANGGTVKVNGVSTNYKTRTLYPNFVRTHSWVKKGSGYIGKLSGKYVAAVTTTNKKPELNLNGTIKSPDDAAKAIATATISGSKVTIKPKAEGDVYVWVLWYPKSGIYQEDRLQNQLEYAMTKVHVATAPAAVRLYADSSANPVNADTAYTSVTMPAGGSTDVYVKGTVGSITKNANTMRVIDNAEIGYNCTVPAKYASYITVTKDASNPQLFHIKTEDTILNLVKEGKKLTVTLPFVCDKNGKKANFKLIVGNLVKSSVLSAADDTTKLTADNTKKLTTVTLDSAKAAAKTAQFNETTTLYNQNKKGTDGTTIIRIPCEDGFSYTAANGIKVEGKVGAAQKKVSIAAVKKKPGTFKVTAAKGTPGGTEAYFVLMHNAYGRVKGNGFQIIKVKVGEANHVSKMSVDKADDNTVVKMGNDKIASVTMGAEKTKATTAQLQETITLQDGSKEGTDGTSIFRMPAADSFTVTTAKEITVTDALSAQQKKVTMTAVKGKAGVYKISAAKGIQPGTEVYFMLFHNAESGASGTGYQIIKVTAGEANHVTKTAVEKANDTTVITTGSDKIPTVTMTANKKAATTAEILEKLTLRDSSKEGTDILKIVRMPAVNGFSVTKSKEIQVKGSLSAQQKKVTMAAVKGKTGVYKITAAKGIKAGTEVYFMLFHNAEGTASGTGYQIIRVVLQ